MFTVAFDWILAHPTLFNRALERHLTMCAIAIGLGLTIGLGLALSIVNSRRLAAVAVNGVNALRTVPSLAILALMMPLLGIGIWPAVVALTILAIPPILLNSYVGLRDVDPTVLDAAVGMGMTRGQILRKTRLPLAAPAIFAGARTATVQVLAGATLAPFIGGGGLGDFIAQGIGMMDSARMLVGAIPIALLALTAEFSLGSLEKLLFTPRVGK